MMDCCTAKAMSLQAEVSGEASVSSDLRLGDKGYYRGLNNSYQYYFGGSV